MNRVAQKVSLALTGFFVSFALLEAGARLFLRPPQVVEVDRLSVIESVHGAKRSIREEGSHATLIDWSGPKGVRLRKNVRAEIVEHALSRRDIVIETSSIGLRYPELGPKAPDEFRVLVLGDSITFGDFVDVRETYTSVLEELARGAARRIRFINAGLPGASTSEEFYYYMELRDVVQPDLVLVQMYLNDAQKSGEFRVRAVPPPFSSSRLLVSVADRVGMLRTWLLRTAALPPEIPRDWREGFRNGRNLRTGDMMNTRDGFDFEIYNAYMDFGLAWHPGSWTIIESVLRIWKAAVSETSARLAVAIFPVHIQVLGTMEDYRPQEECRRICRRLGIAFHDVIPALRTDWKTRRERLFYDHCHYTPYGYGVIAKDLFAWLESERLIPP